ARRVGTAVYGSDGAGRRNTPDGVSKPRALRVVHVDVRVQDLGRVPRRVVERVVDTLFAVARCDRGHELDALGVPETHEVSHRTPNRAARECGSSGRYVGEGAFVG